MGGISSVANCSRRQVGIISLRKIAEMPLFYNLYAELYKKTRNASSRRQVGIISLRKIAEMPTSLYIYIYIYIYCIY